MSLRSGSYQDLVRSAPRTRIGRTTVPVKEIVRLFPLQYWIEASAVPINLDKVRCRCRVAVADDRYGAIVDDIKFVSGYDVDLVRASKPAVARLLASVAEQR